MDIQSGWVGELVRLNHQGKKLRVEGMKTWEGMVIGERAFLKRDHEGDVKSSKFQLVVDWGQGRIWTEDPDWLVKV